MTTAAKTARSTLAAGLAAACCAAPCAAETSLAGSLGSATLTLAEMQAAAPGVEPVEVRDKWRLELDAYVWALWVSGDTRVREHTADVSANAEDTISDSDSVFAYVGRFELGQGKWGVFVDATYADITAKDQRGVLNLSADLEYEMTTVDIGVLYRLSEWVSSAGAARNRRDASIDLYAGARYTNLDVDSDTDMLQPRSYDADWWDPIVGVRFVAPISERWRFTGNADIGGFDVNSGLIWSLMGVFSYEFRAMGMPAAMSFGYKAMQHDYTEGSPPNRLEWDMVHHGPVFGLSLWF